MLYDDVYHTVVVAPATSNTVAKCAFGISDTLPTNMFAQAGKLGIPGIVFACDTEPVVVTKSPHDWVTLRPRRIELDNVERLRGIDFCQVVCSPAELEAALRARLRPTFAGMEHIVFLTGRLAQPQLETVLAGIDDACPSPGRCARSACRLPR
jgi:dihydromethanopterin reductase (acceptor)